MSLCFVIIVRYFFSHYHNERNLLWLGLVAFCFEKCIWSLVRRGELCMPTCRDQFCDAGIMRHIVPLFTLLLRVS
jgi:hypothetical protein